jgi:UPF0716 protein FxsA
MKSLFLIFLVIPLVEIYFLIKIGSAVGAALTVFLVVFTAMLGAFLVRTQGFSTLARVQMQLARAEVPAMEIMEGVFLFVAGALLLTPGFFTDAIGFVFLTPPLRRGIIKYYMGRRSTQAGSWVNSPSSTESTQSSTGQSSTGRIIDVEYKDID